MAVRANFGLLSPIRLSQDLEKFADANSFLNPRGLGASGAQQAAAVLQPAPLVEEPPIDVSAEEPSPRGTGAPPVGQSLTGPTGRPVRSQQPQSNGLGLEGDIDQQILQLARQGRPSEQQQQGLLNASNQANRQPEAGPVSRELRNAANSIFLSTTPLKEAHDRFLAGNPFQSELEPGVAETPDLQNHDDFRELMDMHFNAQERLGVENLFSNNLNQTSEERFGVSSF